MKLFLNLLLVIIVSLSCSSSKINGKTGRVEKNYQLSILQTATTSNSAMFRVVAPAFLEISPFVFDSNNKEIKIKKLDEHKRSFSKFVVRHYFVDGLREDSSYRLEFRSNQKRWNDTRNFKTLAVSKNKFKILVTSCTNDEYNEIGNMIWTSAFAHRPDFLFMIGDNIYADTYSGIYLGKFGRANPQHLWNRYVDHALKMKVYRMKDLVPTYATWDDHDYGVNNGDSSYPYKEDSKKIFKIFFPQIQSDSFKSGPGVSSLLEVYGQRFFFLDNRYFRGAPDNKKGDHLGDDQLNWLSSHLASKMKVRNWVISGDQFFGGYHRWESYEGQHPAEFSKFKKTLKDSPQDDYLFISGDRHLVELMSIDEKEVGKNTYEFTVSGTHTKMYPGSLKGDHNKRRIGGFDGVANYGLFHVNLDFVKFEGYSLEKKEVEQKAKR